jgi:hypothetical protein
MLLRRFQSFGLLIRHATKSRKCKREFLSLLYIITKFNKILRIAVFWDVTPCNFVDGYQRFRGSFCLYLQGRRVAKSFSLIWNSIQYKVECVFPVGPNITVEEYSLLGFNAM